MKSGGDKGAIHWNPEEVANVLKRFNSSQVHSEETGTKAEYNPWCFDHTTTYTLNTPLGNSWLRLKKVELRKAFRGFEYEEGDKESYDCRMLSVYFNTDARLDSMTFYVEVKTNDVWRRCKLALLRNENSIGDNWDFEHGRGGFFRDEYACDGDPDSVVEGVKQLLGINSSPSRKIPQNPK